MKQDSDFWDGLIERGKMFLEGVFGIIAVTFKIRIYSLLAPN